MDTSISISGSNKWKKFNSMVVVISPLLVMYGVGISTITLLDVIVLICFLTSLINVRGLNIVSFNYLNKYIWIIITLVIVNLLITLCFQTNGRTGFDVFLRTMRFVYYLFFCCFCLDERNFNVKFGLKVYEFLTVFSSIYLILQFFLLFAYGFSLPGYVPFLPLMREELEIFTSNLTVSDYLRPRSLFGEPSHLGIYVCGYLSLSFFYGIKERFAVEKWIIVLAALLSASTTAVLGLVAILCVALVGFLKKKQISYSVLGIIVFIIFGVFLYMDFIIERLGLFIVRIPSSFLGRYECFFDYFDKINLFGFRELLLGIGMDMSSVTMWYAGLAKILLYWGLLGGGMLTCVIVLYFIRMRGAQRKAFIIFLILSIFSEIFVSNWLILLLPFVLRDLTKYKDVQTFNFGGE